MFLISCKGDRKTTIQLTEAPLVITEATLTVTPAKKILTVQKISRTTQKDDNKGSITPTAKKQIVVIESTSVLGPTNSTIITPTSVNIGLSEVSKNESKVETSKLTEERKDIALILSEAESNMSVVESFTFGASGTIGFITGDTNVAIPIISGGIVYRNISRSFSEINFLGFPIKSETHQSGALFYYRDGSSGRWIESEKAGLGHISPGFWDQAGPSLFDLAYRYNSEDREFQMEETIFLVSDDDMKDEAIKLIEFSLGATEDILYSQEMEASVILGISEIDHYLEIIKATVKIEKGGNILSQILNLPQLSTIGSVTIDLQIEFDQFGSTEPLSPDPNN